MKQVLLLGKWGMEVDDMGMKQVEATGAADGDWLEGTED